MGMLIVETVLFGSIVYAFENGAHNDENGVAVAFVSIPEAMWFTFVTITTVGYGDMSPKTVPGRIFGVGRRSVEEVRRMVDLVGTKTHRALLLRIQVQSQVRHPRAPSQLRMEILPSRSQIMRILLLDVSIKMIKYFFSKCKNFRNF